MTVTLLLCNLKLLFDFFPTNLSSSLLIFIRTYMVNYRSALDRLHVHMNIILFKKKFHLLIKLFSQIRLDQHNK